MPTAKEVIFYSSAIFLVALLGMREPTLWAFPAIIFGSSALVLARVIFSVKAIYTGILFGFNAIFSVFVFWVIGAQGRITPEPQFDFSVFRDDYLERAALVCVTSTILTWVAWRVLYNSYRNYGFANGNTGLAIVLEKFRRFGSGLSLILHLLSLVAIIYFLTINPTVLSLQYPSNVAQHSTRGEFLKLPVFGVFVAYLIIYTKSTYQKNQRNRGHELAIFNFISIVAVTFLYLLMVGARGLCVFLWLLLGAMEIYNRAIYRRVSYTGLLFIILAVWGYVVFPSLRANLWSAEGLPLHLYVTGIEVFSEPASGNQVALSDIPMLSQSLFHLLYVIDLVERDISRGGLTFLNLIPQFIPEFMDPEGSFRPVNDNWLLGEYYGHGGGFLSVANAYWNGGMSVAIIFSLVLACLSFVVDRVLLGKRTGVLYSTVYFFWIPVFVVQLAYGIQGLARVFQLLAVIAIVDRMVTATHGRGGFRGSVGMNRKARY